MWEDYLVSRYEFNTDIGYLVMMGYDGSVIYVSTEQILKMEVLP